MASSTDTSQCENDLQSKVKLGFVDEIDWRLMTSKFFPSKVGGKPAWLSLDPVPESELVKCSICGGPTVFLMQVYAPLKTDDTFHRTIFIFVCFQDSCAKENGSQNFKVLRSQLALKNVFYSQDPPDEDLDSDEDCSSFPHARCFQNVCTVCGIKSSKKCAKCKKTYYCTRDHQTQDWKYQHKRLCDEIANQTDDKMDDDQGHGLLFKEYELLVEEEEVDSESSRKNKSDKERMEEYKMMMKALKIKGSVDESAQYAEEDLDQAATGETDDDKYFLRFRKKIEPEPTQVLRYLRGGEPLWVSAFHKPGQGDIPQCSCGSERIFEFQVMPQLLNHLNAGSLDWGTLCVYTCAESCDIGNEYREEVLWKQDFYNVKRN